MRRVLLLALVFGQLIALTLAANLRASPDFIDSEEATITVSWNDVNSPKANDWIGVFCPPDSPFAKVLVRRNVTSQSSSGKTDFKLLNMRDNYLMKYFTADGTNWRVVAQSNIVKVNAGRPLQGHIALTGNHSEMRVTWVSGVLTNGYVQYGETPSYNMRASGRSYTYEIDQLCGGRALSNFRHPGIFYDVVLKGLKPSTRYYYRFGSDQYGWSDDLSFVTQPDNNDPNQEVRFLAFGDLGTSHCEDMAGWCELPSSGTTDNLAKEIDSHDFVLHIGDISYAVGWAVRWDQFFYQIQPIATRAPWMAVVGNHEADFPGNYSNYMNGTDSGGECGTPFRARFPMPNNVLFDPKSKPNAADVWWYSFEYGNIHFTIMSTEHDFRIGSPQHKWMVNDLASVDRSKTPWVIVAGHRPMYVSTYSTSWLGDQQVGERMRKHLEDVFMQYQVDLALWGHTHLFERTCAVYEQHCYGTEVNPPAPIHSVVGMAGMGLSHNLVQPQPNWSTFRNDTNYGYSRIHTANSTHLHLEFVANNGQEVLHDFWIVNENHRY